jgi:hypothetical protein
MINNGGYCVSDAEHPILTPLVQQNTSLMLQQTAEDGYTLVEPAVQLWNQMGEEDRWQVEGPMLRRSEDGTYFLFNDDSYTVSYVTSVDGVKAPYGQRQRLVQTGISDSMDRVVWISRWMGRKWCITR